MTIIQAYKNKVAVSEVRSALESFLTTKLQANREVFEALSRMSYHYGGSIFPNRNSSHMTATAVREPVTPDHWSDTMEKEPVFSKRYSVLYRLGEQYRHLSCSTSEQAREALKLLLEDGERNPVGIYDDKTELFEWEHSLREEYEKASMKDQGRRGEEIIHIAQALRRRDWDLGEFRRPSLYA